MILGIPGLKTGEDVNTPRLPVSKVDMIKVLNPLKGHDLGLLVDREGSMEPFNPFVVVLIRTFQELG